MRIKSQLRKPLQHSNKDCWNSSVPQNDFYRRFVYKAVIHINYVEKEVGLSKRKSLIILLVLALVAVGVGSAAWIHGLTAFEEFPTDDSGWRLIVDGFVQRPLNLTLNKIRAMPKTIVYAELYCVGAPTIVQAKGNWSGVTLGYILEQAGVEQAAIKVLFYADDGFTTDLDIATAMRSDIVVAYERDGETLDETLRLVVPGKWGYKWIREITRIELVDYNALGTWESGGYSDTAEISEEHGNFQ